ncbi:uncharacterized protein LOC113851465 [Abrus precatorius]|uniref:Uncharacterized protein LOC113851465 n=1 Tax=Abrus precatorius TaxID=3816 RepID=A0A8B8K3X0_ABRPR|nr:uncharacterized protein LOC113851465 [Abrus precatorius]
MKPTISRSRISLSPSPLSLSSFFLCSLLCASLACANLLDQIEHCELDCQSETVDGLNVVGNCQPKCSQGLTIPSHIEKEGQEAIKKYLDNLFSNALLGVDSSATDQSRSKTPIKHDGEDKNNKDVEKSAYKNGGEEELLDGDIEVNVGLEIVGDGEYVLKIKRVISTSNDEVERAKQMAQNGAMLSLYGEILRDMGERMLAQSQASLYSIFKMPVPPKSMSDE